MDKISEPKMGGPQSSTPQVPVTAKDGPHRKVKKEAAADSGPQPPYIVAIKSAEAKKSEAENGEPNGEATKLNAKYDPKELRAKARALLSNDHVPLEQRRVLKEILGPEDKG